MKTARLLITRECNKTCSYCCNQYSNIMKGLKTISNLKPLLGRKEVCITGGEPMLVPERVVEVATILRHFGTKRIYLYSADLPNDNIKYLKTVLPYVDGLHYTLHKNSTYRDVHIFHAVQQEIRFKKDMSFRLYIHKSITEEITIIPNAWNEIRITGWIAEENCDLPENEELFELVMEA